MKKIMTINGMMCDHCRMHVEEALNSIDGVNAKVDLANRSAEIILSEAVGDDVLEKAVRDAGYEPVSIKAEV